MFLHNEINFCFHTFSFYHGKIFFSFITWNGKMNFPRFKSNEAFLRVCCFESKRLWMLHQGKKSQLWIIEYGWD